MSDIDQPRALSDSPTAPTQRATRPYRPYTSPTPTLTGVGKSTSERIADAIEAEESRLRRLTPGHDDWQSPEFRMGMLHAAAIARSTP